MGSPNILFWIGPLLQPDFLILTISPLLSPFSLFRIKKEKFLSDIYPQKRLFIEQADKPNADTEGIICRLSIFFSIFATFWKSWTPGESNIWENVGEDTRIEQGIKGHFSSIKHPISMTTVFIATTTVFIAPGCRIHPIRRRSPRQWRRSSREKTAHLTAATDMCPYFPSRKPLTEKGISQISRCFSLIFYNKHLRLIIDHTSYYHFFTYCLLKYPALHDKRLST